MYKVIMTSALDDADDMEANVVLRESLQAAVEQFNDSIKNILSNALRNEHLVTKVSLHKHKAVIKLESRTYCIAIIGE